MEVTLYERYLDGGQGVADKHTNNVDQETKCL